MGPVVEGVPVVETGALALVGPLGRIAGVAVEVQAIRRDVVEDPVEDNADTPLRRRLDQPPVVEVGAQIGVNAVVVGGIVEVLGGSHEDRIEVDGQSKKETAR